MYDKPGVLTSQVKGFHSNSCAVSSAYVNESVWRFTVSVYGDIEMD
ncbi:MAG: hypothetical protein HFH82_17250 [Lachnospiraceae bacterium]|nr:hypothetical protein [Lachnospiraceae bacterium]